MKSFAARLIAVGCLLLLSAGVYFLMNVKTDSELTTAQLRIDIANIDRRVGFRNDDIERLSAREIHKQTLQRAYWPAGFGVLFLLVGWASLGAKKTPD